MQSDKPCSAKPALTMTVPICECGKERCWSRILCPDCLLVRYGPNTEEQQRSDQDVLGLPYGKLPGPGHAYVYRQNQVVFYAMGEGWNVAVGRLHNKVLYPIDATEEKILAEKFALGVSDRTIIPGHYQFCLWTEPEITKLETIVRAQGCTLHSSFRKQIK